MDGYELDERTLKKRMLNTDRVSLGYVIENKRPHINSSQMLESVPPLAPSLESFLKDHILQILKLYKMKLTDEQLQFVNNQTVKHVPLLVEKIWKISTYLSYLRVRIYDNSMPEEIDLDNEKLIRTLAKFEAIDAMRQAHVKTSKNEAAADIRSEFNYEADEKPSDSSTGECLKTKAASTIQEPTQFANNVFQSIISSMPQVNHKEIEKVKEQRLVEARQMAFSREVEVIDIENAVRLITNSYSDDVMPCVPQNVLEEFNFFKIKSKNFS